MNIVLAIFRLAVEYHLQLLSRGDRQIIRNHKTERLFEIDRAFSNGDESTRRHPLSPISLCRKREVVSPSLTMVETDAKRRCPGLLPGGSSQQISAHVLTLASCYVSFIYPD